MKKDEDSIKKYLSGLGKKSWEAQKDKKDTKFFREMQRKSVISRAKNKETDK